MSKPTSLLNFFCVPNSMCKASFTPALSKIAALFLLHTPMHALPLLTCYTLLFCRPQDAPSSLSQVCVQFLLHKLNHKSMVLVYETLLLRQAISQAMVLQWMERNLMLNFISVQTGNFWPVFQTVSMHVYGVHVL